MLPAQSKAMIVNPLKISNQLLTFDAPRRKSNEYTTDKKSPLDQKALEEINLTESEHLS